MDYIKHTISVGVLSYFNPIISLKPQMRQVVNRQFITPILETFFKDKGGIQHYELLDTDLLKTEIDFEEDLNFVRGFLYKNVIESIWKDRVSRVYFKPRFVITFDHELTPETDSSCYPYKEIFNLNQDKNFHIKYGTMTLGEVPILFFIRLHLPTLIRFLKTHRDIALFDSYAETSSEKSVIDLTTRALNEVRREIETVHESQRLFALQQQEQILLNRINSPNVPLQGRAGKLRINLQWNTIDDLDLHVIDPNGNEIFYGNKQAICQDKIGLLDIDANAGTYTTIPPPQENISWEEAPYGEYKIFVTLFTKRESIENIPFFIQILGYNSLGRVYSGALSFEKEKKEIASFSFLKNKGLDDFKKLI